MRFVFHADASKQKGSGHVLRSSVLAQEVIATGHQCIFVGQIKNLNWVYEHIKKIGFDQIHETFTTFKSEPKKDILIIDSYDLPVDSLHIQPDSWKLVVCISDELTPNYKCDLKIKPSLSRDAKELYSNSVLCGPEYLLIRKSIVKNRNQESDFIKIIVSGGGTDVHGFSTELAKILDEIPINIEVHFFAKEINKSKYGKTFINHKFGPELDLVCEFADLAFTTASTSSFEFIAREIPTGVACAVKNQEDYYKQLGELNYAEQIGSFKDDKWYLDKGKIINLVMCEGRRLDLKARIHNLVDLNGASRVLNRIENHIKAKNEF